VILFMHRRDLRDRDMAAFDYMAKRNLPSLHVLVLDPFLLKHGRENEHSGRNFLQHVVRLQKLYAEAGQKLHLLYGEPAEVLERLLECHPLEELVVHRDFTPYAIVRDRKLKAVAEQRGIPITSLTDHSLVDLTSFQSWTGRSEPYKVFTPFYRKWKDFLHYAPQPASSIRLSDLHTVDIDQRLVTSYKPPFTLEDYVSLNGQEPEVTMRGFFEERLAAYSKQRNDYAIEGTSTLSRHINVGALSVREINQTLHLLQSTGSFHSSQSLQSAQTRTSLPDYEPWFRQLCWRDFYIYQSVYDRDFFQYEKKFNFTSLSTAHFDAWRRAETGIPLIDAAMTELNETGRMANRLRMIVAMFLTKNLLCPFPLGEQYFRYQLTDYDNTLNRGGWLWSSSLGFDAAPYFRIMNPVTQSETYDPTGSYIRRWLPKLAHLSDSAIHQPQSHAIVNLKISRARAIEVYKEMLRGTELEGKAEPPADFTT
jgi:deoxyribodipyrimidine photo-lyase